MNRVWNPMQQFAATLEGVAGQLTAFTGEFQDRETDLLKVLHSLAEETNVRPRLKRLPPDIEKAVEEGLGRLREAVRRWEARAVSLVKGQEFIRDYERSVVVLVYGKVNCGKSTLGNFLAGRRFETKSGHPYGGLKADVFEYVSVAGKLRRRPLPQISASPFQTSATECTRSIQGFTLGGLTWIDTPGIGSMTPENHSLAREYAAHSELIIYLTSSDSPARRSDVEALRELVGEGKRILVAVSKFDTPQEIYDENDEVIGKEWRPKPERARGEQQAWIEQQIQDSGLDAHLADRRFSFLSVNVAEEALQRGDVELLEQSGFPEFYRQLVASFENGAAEVKRSSPRRRFNQIVHAIADGTGEGSVHDTRARFHSLLSSLVQRREELLSLAPRAALLVRARAAGKVEVLLKEAAREVERGGRPDRLSERVSDVIRKAIEEILTELVNDVLAGADADVVKHLGALAVEVGDIKERETTISVSDAALKKGIGSTAGGLLGGLLVFLSGPIGWIAGGVGAVAGAYLGGKAGEAFASDKKMKVSAGTNVGEVVGRLFDDLDAKLPSKINESLSSLAEALLEPRLDQLRHLDRKLQRLRGDILKLTYSEERP